MRAALAVLFSVSAFAQPDPLFTYANVPWFNDASYVLELPGQWYLKNQGTPWILRQNGNVVQTLDGGNYDIGWSEQDSGGVIVGIVDSGADQHADLRPFMEPVAAGDGHGTGMAGIVAAIRGNAVGMAGVCNANLLVVGTDWTVPAVARGIEHCATSGVRVLLLAWGTSFPDTALSNACWLAYEKDVFIVAATLNIDADLYANPDYPLWYHIPSVLAVSAANQFGGRYIGCSGTNVLIAPGRGIVRTKGTNQYCYANGTSDAAAITAGVASIVAARFPNQNAEALREVLLTASTPVVGVRGRLSMTSLFTSPIPVVIAGDEVKVVGLSKWKYVLEHSLNLTTWQDYGVVLGGESLPAVEGFYRARIL